METPISCFPWIPCTLHITTTRSLIQDSGSPSTVWGYQFQLPDLTLPRPPPRSSVGTAPCSSEVAVDLRADVRYPMVAPLRGTSGTQKFSKTPQASNAPIRCFENLSVINIHPYINHVYIFIYNMYRHRHIISIFHGLIMLNPPLTEATFFMEHWAPGPGLHPGSGQQLQGRTAEASLTRDRLVGLHPQGKPIGKPMGNTCQGWIARNLTTGLGVVINLGKATRRFGGSSARDWWNYFRDWFSMPPIWRREKRHQRSWEFTNN